MWETEYLFEIYKNCIIFERKENIKNNMLYNSILGKINITSLNYVKWTHLKYNVILNYVKKVLVKNLLIT